MSDGYDLALSIGGEIRDAETARRLVNAILETEMANEWDAGRFADADDVLAHIEAIGEGRHLTMVCRPDDDAEAEPILAACRNLGLPYNLSVGHGGEDDFRREHAWRTGWAEEIEAGSADNDFHVSLDTLKDAIKAAQASGDLSPVVALRDAVAAVHADPSAFSVANGVVERLKALDEDEWETELVEAAPAP